MERTITDFGEKSTTENFFYCNDNKNLFNIDNVNINEILISRGLFPALIHNYYVIGYDHNQKIKPLYIKLPKNVCTGKTFKKILPYLLKLMILIFLKNTIKYGRKLGN